MTHEFLHLFYMRAPNQFWAILMVLSNTDCQIQYSVYCVVLAERGVFPLGEHMIETFTAGVHVQ